jgi:eukaryotic-like serine/threonine-protein kinase
MSSTPGAPPLPPPVLAQRYRLERRLAQGGMAEVWLATDTSLSRQVAVKLLKAGLARDPVVAERFRREAVAVAKLTHPNIVAVYDAVEEPVEGSPELTRQAVVMQFVNGKSLRQLLDEQRRLSPDLTMHIGMCVAAALDVAHNANLVHRDVKPANIMITHDGRVLLTDFGIAKGVDGDDDLTSANIMMGTAKYLSPEQVRGKKLDGRADLYSLGLVLYECLAGRVPFLGETDTDTALARLNRDPTDLARLRPTLPYGLAELIHRVLARRPMDRPPTCAAFRSELSAVIEQHKANPRPLDHTATPTGTPVRGAGGYRPTSAGGLRTPATGQGRPAGAPVLSSDRTPPNASRPRPKPNRQFEQRRTPSLVVGGLLLASVIIGFVLWKTAGDNGNDGFVPPSSVVVDPNVATTAAGSSGPEIAGVSSYDPGADGDEREELAEAAIDGDPESAWRTNCYEDRYVFGKGLVIELAQASTGAVTAIIGSGPYQAQIFATDAESIPGSLDGWGDAVEQAASPTPGAMSATLSQPARFVLVWMTELAEDGGCNDNPYRGQINEITVAA